jgi:V/A-type H+-transporting ATPase subunit E
MTMNGIDKITKRILADAEAEAKTTVDEATARCAEIQKAYEQKAQETYWELVRAGVKETEQRVQRIDRTAEMEAKKSILALKQEMVDEAFEAAKKRLLGLPEKDYVEFLSKLAVQASGSGQEEILLNARDRKLYGEKVAAAANKKIGKGRLTVSEETREIEGGLILKDGDVEVNCAIETLLNLYRDDLATQVAEIMFGA